MSFKLSRRELIQKTIAGFGIISAPVALTACGSDDSDTPQAQANFKHGVASGDPLQDRVILWTRLTPTDQSARLEVVWEIASDANFTKIVNTGRVQTQQSQDFCVKVDADRLQAGQNYFYRFRYGQTVSPVGRTKTLAKTTNAVKLAVCSCSNYPAGYFHVYKEMAKQDLDAVIHLGDYIYEYGQGEYATEDADKMGRNLASDNNKEIIKLDDYRKRYALYRTDPDLQAIHQRHPFIVIWDDHELANDTWREGAGNHQPDADGVFVDRKLAALQAYFEWMPIRPSATSTQFNIYRQFEFGNLVNLMMIDTRILDRDQQLDYKHYLNAQGIDFARFQKDLTDPKRKMIGETQRDWLKDRLAASTATWQVIAQQVLMAKVLVPAELLIPLEKVLSGSAQPADLEAIFAQVQALVMIKMRILQGDPTVTEVEKARVSTVAPYNLDAWDGYYAERERVLQMLKALNKKAVILAGDTHNAWSARIKTQEQQEVAVELAVSSISSPGIEKYLGLQGDAVKQLQQAFTILVDDLKYCNLSQRGYMLVNITEQRLDNQWIYVNTVKDKNYVIDTEQTVKLAITPKLEEIKA